MTAAPPPAAGLRVALLNPYDWPEVRRGSERFARELAAALRADGHIPRLISSRRGLPQRRSEDAFDVLRLPRPPAGRLDRRRFEEDIAHAPLSYLALRLGDYDVAHALYVSDALAAARWSARRGRPAVFSYMGIPNREWLGERRRRPELLRAAAARSGAVVALSEAAARALEHWLGIEARVIAPGVDLESFAPGPPRAAAPTLFCAASIGEPRKRVSLLLEGFALLRRSRPDVRLELSRPRSGAQAAAWEPLPPGVSWRDVDRVQQLALANAQAWVAVLPSHDEAFGLVLLEALACGTPVVGAREGGIPEVVDSPAIGRLFEGERPAALAEALEHALELSLDSDTAARCRAAAERFSWQRCAQSYEGLYQLLLA